MNQTQTKRTHYQTAAQIEERIDLFIVKRDTKLETADRYEAASKWYKSHACELDGGVKHGLLQKAQRCDVDAQSLRSEAKYEDEVTIQKLKAKLAEMLTAPLPGVTDAAVAKR
jgi:hypothetical protein